jgi:hypothetical protein
LVAEEAGVAFTVFVIDVDAGVETAVEEAGAGAAPEGVETAVEEAGAGAAPEA